MIEIEINNARQIVAILDRLANATQDRTPLMRSIAGTMESAVLQNFEVGGRPKWLGLKYRQGTPLVDTENLMNSITSYYDNNVAEVGTNQTNLMRQSISLVVKPDVGEKWIFPPVHSWF